MYKEVPLLQFTTVTRIVRNLFNGYDIENLMTEYFIENAQIGGSGIAISKSVEKWSIIVRSVELKIENFPIPKAFKILLSSLAKPIGNRIKRIIKELYNKDYFPMHFTSILHWTLIGTIDVKKTAQAAMKDKNLPVTKHYEIACNYCFEDEISISWSKLSETQKNDYFALTGPIYALRYLTIYWSYYMKEEITRLDRRIIEEYPRPLSSSAYGIRYASVSVNQPAFEYFMGKLSVEEKEKYFAYFYNFLSSKKKFGSHENEVYLCDIIYCLLSQMNELQRRSIFQKYAFSILKHFLEYPYRGLFLQFESYMKEYLTDSEMVDLLILGNYEECCNYFVFKKFSKD